jgi:predicted adenylyl cyclase CyaB
MKNLELKAMAPSLSRLRRKLRAFGASRQPAPLDQVDWYFQVPHGRMKLRQRKGENAAELIFYVRPDAPKARTSEYQKLPVVDPAGMRRLLEATFTPAACVRKRRDLWLHEGTRIHLDRVEGLGSFVEIEVPFGRDAARARRAMQALTDCLGIVPADILSCSYADLLLRPSSGKSTR